MKGGQNCYWIISKVERLKMNQHTCFTFFLWGEIFPITSESEQQCFTMSVSTSV